MMDDRVVPQLLQPGTVNSAYEKKRRRLIRRSQVSRVELFSFDIDQTN